MKQPEEHRPTGDPDVDREYRGSIQDRIVELIKQRRDAQAQQAQLNADSQPAGADTSQLAELPQLPVRLAELPENLQRRLYDAFQLQVRYNKPRHEVMLRVTVREDTVQTLTAAVASTGGLPHRAVGEPRRHMLDLRKPEINRGFPSSVRPVQDSNLRSRLRRPLLYPLS